ncbi:cyclic nucleotide-binding domain-containing protein [Variovorax sp. YR216]|uniref:cyclic nucleotide-binding domain-containing protein n=1 Tax=Variovorax sp. YR216 TaxID=1882828 RepID=UPI0008989154|nr:cyclic nucleotide-binding domain-containing protein [Variovorax sp. YR216]SEB03774.1 CAAX protease self-immunity [Variovorax sp. YR216]
MTRHADTANTAGLEDSARALLGRCAIFRRCSAADLVALARSTRWVDYADGVDLVREGDTPEELLVIEHGQAQVLKRGANGDEHLINRVGPGDSIGEMALFDIVPRSATVRAEGPVRGLSLPLSDIVHLAESRPSLVPVLMDIGALVAERLRVTSANAAAAADRILAQERTRAVMGRFTLLLIMAYTLYTWVLGTAMRVKETFGHSEFVTVPAIFVCCAILFVFVRVSRYPPRFFGLTTENAGPHVREAVLFTLPLMAATVLLKLALVTWVPAMHGQPLIQMFSPSSPGNGFNPWLAAAYVVFAPFQELIYRGGVQGPLSHFLTGRWSTWLAIVGANIIFSAAHLYVSPGLAVVAFVAGLFWGWLYARQGGLVGVSVSHVLLGFWAFEVVDLGVLQ